jgi:hypothetical protein
LFSNKILIISLLILYYTIRMQLKYFNASKAGAAGAPGGALLI